MRDAVDTFFWRKMLERQRRWFEHDLSGKPVRDECSRFVPSADNPLPELNPFDKQWERAFMERLGAPQPRLATLAGRREKMGCPSTRRMS